MPLIAAAILRAVLDELAGLMRIVVELEPDPLKGLPEETRILRISLERPGTADLTVAFSARNEAADLGGRDRIHFVIRGRQAP